MANKRSKGQRGGQTALSVVSKETTGEHPVVKPRDRNPASERLALRKVEAVQGVFTSALRCGAAVGIAWFVYKSAAVLAGQTTTLSAVITAVVNMSIDRWAAWMLAGILGLGYAKERRLRLKTAREMGEHVNVLERKQDPQRSSSGLTLQGMPPKTKARSGE